MASPHDGTPSRHRSGLDAKAWPPLMTAGPRFEMSSRSSDALCSRLCGSQFMARSLMMDMMKPASGKKSWTFRVSHLLGCLVSSFCAFSGS